MLDAMQRVTDGDYIRTLLRNIRKAVPGIAIRTTFITGFPGETEDDHQELMEFIEEFRFERARHFHLLTGGRDKSLQDAQSGAPPHQGSPLQ